MLLRNSAPRTRIDAVFNLSDNVSGPSTEVAES